jgi:GT2 family glycosyltransferase
MVRMSELFVVIPVYGQIGYTHALVPDLWREGIDFVIVDNRGDYEPLGGETVVRPGRNLGWAGGSNMGFRIGFGSGYANVATLNNDTRLSVGFADAMLDTRLPDDMGFLCPVYDDRFAYRHLVSPHTGDAADYEPRDHFVELPACDGTCLMMPKAAWLSVGDLDQSAFGRFSWGADIDLQLRGVAAGFRSYATERAFINHFGRKTATSHFSTTHYFLDGQITTFRVLRKRYGLGVFRRLWSQPIVTRSLETGEVVHRKRERQ